jgi:polysaccharide biosynthesis protein PslG
MLIAKRLRFLALGLCFLTSCSSTQTAWAGPWPDDTITGGLGVWADPERTEDDEMDRIKSLGMNYIRMDMRWNEVEQLRGQYVWTEFDRNMASLHDHNLKAIVILQGGNAAYSGKVRLDSRSNPYGVEWIEPAPTKDEEVKAFAAFAAAAVKRYGTNDVIWEIWNEPDLTIFWAPKPDIEAFSRLATATCQAMRQVDPHATIIGPALAHLPRIYNYYKADYLNAFLQSPVVSCLDAISVHPYRHGDETPETAQDDYRKLSKRMKHYLPGGKSLLIVNSEWGYSLSEVTDEQQAAYALRSYLVDAMSGVPLSLWYSWKDALHEHESDRRRWDREAHFGLVDFDGNDKPAVTVLEEILPHLKDAHIEKRIAVGNDDVYALLLRYPQDKYGLIFWRADRDGSRLSTINVSSKAGTQLYVASFTPTLVCTDSVPSVTLSRETKAEPVQHYFPCPQ